MKEQHDLENPEVLAVKERVPKDILDALANNNYDWNFVRSALDIPEVKEKNKVILEVLNKQSSRDKEIYLHKYGLYGRKPMTYKELRDEYNMPIHHLEQIIRPLTQTIKEKYAKHIQSIT